MRRRAALAALAAACLLPSGAAAQAPAPMPESFEIGLSTETISVGTNFGGTRLVVFGALDNADGRILRQGRYDIVVVLEGPRRPLVVREKDRFLGVWVNRGSERFADVPQSYALAATRPLRDIAPALVLDQLSLGVRNLHLERRSEIGPRPERRGDYAEALRRLKGESGLYTEATGGAIEFVSPTLFRASLTLPGDLPVGRHVARAFLFREGVFLRERSEELWVRKTGLESQISNVAARHGFLYGLGAVLLAVFTGWLGRVIFRRD